MTPPLQISLATSLKNLVASMKPTYLPPISSDLLRLVMLSPHGGSDPLMLLRTGDTTLLIGTGFSSVENSGKVYPTFPDMRLIFSEKDRLRAWILTDASINVAMFELSYIAVSESTIQRQQHERFQLLVGFVVERLQFSNGEYLCRLGFLLSLDGLPVRLCET